MDPSTTYVKLDLIGGGQLKRKFPTYFDAWLFVHYIPQVQLGLWDPYDPMVCMIESAIILPSAGAEGV